MKLKLLLTPILFMLAANMALAAAPTISSFSPAAGPVGSLVTINGTNLGNPTSFTIGGRAAIVISYNSSQITGYVMPNAVTGAITFTNAGGTVSSSLNFTVTATSYPSVQEGDPLIAPAANDAEQGVAVAISADGRTALVGGSGLSVNGNDAGAAWVYVYSGGTWTQQAELTGTNMYAFQGSSVALSADGNTAMVGAPTDNSGTGAVWIYTRTGTTWTIQGNELVGTNAIGIAEQGSSCALSADGNTAILGGPEDNRANFENVGAVWIFTRNGQVWTQQGPKLTASDNAGDANMGSAVALSADGNTLVIGGYKDNNGKGAVWIFTRSAGVWTQQGSKIVGANGLAQDAQGESVAVSADGNIVLIAGAASNLVWAFTNTGGGWTQLGAPFTANNITGTAGNNSYGFGSSIAVSADGNTALIGGERNGDTDSPSPGGTWMFTRSGNTYVQKLGPVLGTGTGTMDNASQGAAVSLSANGATGIIGAPENGATGGAWVFVGNTDANLSGLKISKGTLSPAFATGTTGYTATVVNTVTSFTVTPTVSAVNAKVLVNNTSVTSGTASAAIPLNVGANVISVTAVAPDGATTKTYTVTVTRALSADARLSSVVLSAGTLKPAFTPGTTTYTDGVPNVTTSVMVTPTTTDPNATITVNTTPVTSGSPIAIGNLVLGNNTVTIVVTAQDGATKKIYTITVTRVPSVNADLASMNPSIHPLSPVFKPGIFSYTLDVGNAAASMTVAPVTSEAHATLTVNEQPVTSGSTSGPIALAVGSNAISVVVTAQDGSTTKTYTITVTRAPGGVDGYSPGVSVTQPMETLALTEDGIVVHQGISPNGDGINDFLQIDNISQYPENELTIMNRNGQPVYEAKGYDNGTKVFDGHSNKTGQMQLPGTYFYRLDYTVKGITKHKTGFLVLKY